MTLAMLRRLPPPRIVAPHEFPLQRRRHRSPVRPRPGQAPARHVHRHLAPEPSGAGSHRQFGRRGPGRPREGDRGDPARRRLGRGHGRRARHAGRHPSRGEDPGRRTDPHPPACGRKVLEPQLPVLRRPARRRRVGRQCAVPARRGDDPPRRPAVPHELQGRRPREQPQRDRNGAEEADRHHPALLAGPEVFRLAEDLAAAAQARAAREGRAVRRTDREPAR